MSEDKNDLPVSGEHAPKMTDWEKEPTLRELKLDWESSRTAHDEWVRKVNHWNDLLLVRNSVKPKKRKGRSSVQPKLIRRQAEWRYSALTEPFLASHNMFDAKPSTFEDAQAARQNKMVLNHQFRNQMNRVKFIDDYVRTAVDEGTVIVQTGWLRQTVMIDEEVPVYDFFPVESEEELQPLMQAIELKEANPREYNETVPDELKAAVDYYEESGEPTTAAPNGEVTKVKTEKPIVNKPTAIVRAPQNVHIDPSCEGDLEKALYIGVTFETTKADLLKEGKRYKNLDKVHWDSNTPLNQPDHESRTPETFNMMDTLRKKVVAYEYWGFHDINDDGTLVPIVVTWIGDIIVRMEESPFPDGKLPFVVATYLPVKRELMGEPDAELLEDNQAILGAVTRGLIDLLGRSANGQQGFAKGMLDPLNRRRYEAGEDYEFNPNLTPNAGLIEHKYPDIPQSAMLMLNLQNNDAEALTGVKSFSGGVSGEAYGDVAAGIKGALDAAAKREMGILRRLAHGLVQIGIKFASMNAVFLSEVETVRITNETFEEIKREDLKGNFDLQVDISTAEVDNAKAQDLAFMLQTIGPDEDPEMRHMILSEIAELKRMPELAEKIRSYKPEPDPMLQKQRELEIQKLELEVQELQAKIGLTEAKTEETAAKADQIDLSTVEQETGTKHARDMEKQKGQSQGNIHLETTKALLKPKKENERPGDVEAAIGYAQLAKREDDENTELDLTPDNPMAAPPMPVDQYDPGVM